MVYLLCFERNFRHARHYLGFVKYDLEGRLEQHRTGKGARLMEVISEAGIGFSLSRTWIGDRKLERKLKKRKNSPRLCPICQARISFEKAA
jgi:hypothetical protein